MCNSWCSFFSFLVTDNINVCSFLPFPSEFFFFSSSSLLSKYRGKGDGGVNSVDLVGRECLRGIDEGI